ncbi:hypothetical protein G6O69_09695 [Pseudenhygromyxa sp. WMMC2535]|uniref:putative Ig domain-containing protein n=1 Tax=Pseudenhygromyxa sp. WMMC2535 TaxID=2712867 RepID=UPI0015524898|nr:putative Ig domain-containing protein [Pseudenhygromyxa sp. WMMC2535]NVB38104.1 hypothetical protein [Pseudenhygromyxa sp. WMMC2535]
MPAHISLRVRALAVTVPAIALLITGCSRDELAPDCFEIDPNTGVCLVPDPGGTEAGINCETFPTGAVGATYEFQVEIGGGSGSYSMWEAENLPAGLSIDNNGLISGVPEEAGTFADVNISVFDVGRGSSSSTSCGPLIVNDALSANPVSLETLGCIPYQTSKADMVALLEGGDESEITCRAFTDSGSDTCPLGDGNGRPAPGIGFDEDSCQHSGTINSDYHGTWVWMIEVEQSDYTIAVPYCVTNELDTYHEIALSVDGDSADEAAPAIFAYDGVNSLAFGNGSHVWDIIDPNCPGTDCNSFGFKYDVTCSPFDAIDGWEISLSPSSGTDTGLTHQMIATGPAVSEKFTRRPFVASFEMAYCTSSDNETCAVENSTFDQNAQTKYHFDVVGFPTL